MSVTKSLVTSDFGVLNATQFVNTFYNETGSKYYMFVGKHTPYANSDANIVTPNNSVFAKSTDIYDNMIFAKRIEGTDVVHMIPKYMWKSGEVYAEYSHLDGDLNTKNFFVVVNDSSEYNVYKCLFNNGGAPTGVSAPARVGSAVDLQPIITSDGYIWKYMYTITKTQWEKFATSLYVPVTANTDVISSAVPGTIDVIKVIDGGAGYSNYIASAVFKVGDIAVGGVNTIYGAPEDASPIDDYYQGCVLKITSGAGTEQYRKIINYEGVGTQKKFIIDSPFTVLPSENDTYDVYPYVFIWGDGNESIPAEGRVLIETSANSIYDVEVLTPGEGYRSVKAVPGAMPESTPITINTAYIQLSETITQDPAFVQAELQPIISPIHGHGSDPLSELGASRVCVSTKFSQSESGSFPVFNDFRQIGIIKDPLFTNVDLILNSADSVGSFIISEDVYQYKQIKLYGNVSVTTSGNTIVKTNQGKISNTIQILNAGKWYDDSANNTVVFNNTGTGGSGAVATFTTNNSVVVQSSIRSNTSIATSNFIGLASANTIYTNGDRVKYTAETSGINGLSNGSYYYINAANTTGFKLATTPDGVQLTITANTTDTGNVAFAVINGAITSVTVTNQGSNYTSAPTASINMTAAAGGSNAQLLVSIANPQVTMFTDSFSVGDKVLVSDGAANFVATVLNVPNDYTITCDRTPSFMAENAEISALTLEANGKVSSVSSGQITLTDVNGIFSEGSRIVGVKSSATSKIATSNNTVTTIQINDKTAGSFNKSLQLTRLIGDFTAGSSSFIDDELVIQESLISYAMPKGYVHHVELNGGTDDDILYISNQYGIFNLDPKGVRTIVGQSSGATLDGLTNKYPGDFVKDSGKVLYYENIDPITRSDNKSEIVKIVLEF